jgi:hypothetical protein
VLGQQGKAEQQAQQVGEQPATPGPSANGENAILNSDITTIPPTAIGNVWW